MKTEKFQILFAYIKLIKTKKKWLGLILWTDFYLEFQSEWFSPKYCVPSAADQKQTFIHKIIFWHCLLEDFADEPICKEL